MDFSGNFYNATERGGAAEGTVYKLSLEGSETVLHSFGVISADGVFPVDGVIMDGTGNLYGTTLNGGSAAFGTAYRVSPAGAEVVLHTFGSIQGDGIGPYGPLVIDRQGILYGTTIQGGAFGFGTVYKLNPAGTETILHSFRANGQDGVSPTEGLIMDKQGNLYGTTIAGGLHDEGTVFETSSTGGYRTLYSFGAAAGDGSGPATLTLDSQGNLYGTTAFGGTHGDGTVFKLSRGTWSETVVYSFGSNLNDGQDPLGAPVFDTQGNLYGTTLVGGVAGCGTAYKLSPGGTETILHEFGGVGDGCNPDGGLFRDAKGDLYGVTSGGGNGAYSPGGVVYKITQ
jgi:uncharacterized repeat protein (TIGR03803 family)